MNLVQRYIQAVKTELPPAQREDIGRELHMIALGLRGANGARVLFFNLPPELPLRSYTYRALLSMYPADHRPALEAVRVPLLVLVGSRDESFRAAEYPPVIAAHTSGTVEVLEGASHESILTDARTFEAVRRWWLKQ